MADGGERAAVERANPRLAELAAKYGMMAGLTPGGGPAMQTASGAALGSSMLRLSVTFSAADGRTKTVTKRLPSASACVPC